jgi:hypothetical protein
LCSVSGSLAHLINSSQLLKRYNMKMSIAATVAIVASSVPGKSQKLPDVAAAAEFSSVVGAWVTATVTPAKPSQQSH